MTETWLRPNLKAIRLGFALPTLMLLVGGALVAFFRSSESSGGSVVGQAIGWVVIGAAALLILLLASQFRQPRLAYRNGALLVYMRSKGPIELPVVVAEAFFLGRGPSMLPSDPHHRRETVTLVLRIAESATDWTHRETNTAIGNWCGGYVTFRGTWCEPLNVEVANRLNRRLAEVKRLLADSTGTLSEASGAKAAETA